MPAARGSRTASPNWSRGTSAWLQHASILGSALLFWQAVLGRCGRANPGGTIAGLFVTALHSGLLGVLLTFARTPLYPGQSSTDHGLGLTPLEDQQLAGRVHLAGVLLNTPANLIARQSAMPRTGITGPEAHEVAAFLYSLR